MPVISKFYGITITMYFRDSEHDPPHIHAKYSGNAVSVDIKKCVIMDGFLPPKALELVMEWVAEHSNELIEIWETQVFKRIEPLE